MKPELSLLWKHSRKRLPFALLASSLAVGCGQPAPEPSESPAPSAPQVEAALGTALQALEGDAARPVVESLFAIPQGAASKSTATVFQLRLKDNRAENEAFRGGTLTMAEGTQQLTFRDDGQGGDAVAGDLLFTASGTFDFVALQAQQQRIAQAQSQSQTQLTTAVFENRQLVRTVPVTALSTQFPVGQPVPIQPIGLASLVDPARSLIIRAPAVVNDVTRTYDPCTGAGNPNGKWTFNYLMTEMANQPFTGVAPTTFVREWLRQWEQPRTINGFVNPPRTSIAANLIGPWPKLASGELNLARSPFKLIAIVNRLDLAGSNPAYGSGSAGEGRFIFAATTGVGSSCYTVPFLVILEYGVDKNGCTDIKAYAQQWQALSGMALGSATYNAALEALTEQFARRDLSPRKPNRSSINQVRTNDEWLASPWELREFRLWNSTINPNSFSTTPPPVPSMLSSHTVAQTPDRIRQTTLFPAYVNATAPAIVAGTYSVPLLTSGTFRAGRAVVTNPTAIPPFWSQPASIIPNRQARHVFSLNTCDGCHGDELGTNFTHVSWTGALSPFLSGALTVPDRADGTPVRTFNEVLARQTFLDQMANQSCLTSAFVTAAPSVH
ncbi:hypothetical protein D7X55_03280 [Corallococcus sp. AB049A]|uniref:hypothetical protein n=1 Tax=Corallococcus sp. AB049A TaxID=2316721 RepID=UPI000ED83FF8|nr:hypothetical protein [Corallococcus sp. AB049A]RKI74124.1 hypothetical protein D7X55_03280 [Corallococcus sp. AB049A]